VPSSRGAVAGALEAAHFKTLGRGKGKGPRAADVVTVASAAAHAPSLSPLAPRGRRATPAALVAHAAIHAALESSDTSAWPFAPASALEAALTKIYHGGDGGAGDVLHPHGDASFNAANGLLNVLAPLCAVSGGGEVDAGSLPGGRVVTVDLRLALAVLACFTDCSAEDGLTAAHTILTLHKGKGADVARVVVETPKHQASTRASEATGVARDRDGSGNESRNRNRHLSGLTQNSLTLNPRFFKPQNSLTLKP
jgi:hypothetical protein